ncbi:hypothetical protein AAFC00_006626 [Neodothiora populina]|uniref:DUF676 domain-containing protein n=1 Tax=Neodothiora populina TaxID=2781224 RepID=A0ABR3PAK9_9PEZI
MALTVVHEPPPEVTCKVDVVAVHGLNFLGSRQHGAATWMNGEALWIRDFLLNKLSVPSRVMLFEHNSSSSLRASALGLDDHAKKLLTLLMMRRDGVLERPLIFICHSLGGLLV